MTKNLTVYELYDRRSLADFLDFKDVNPDAPLVYVLQHPPESINILGAAEYGNLVICLPKNSQMIFSTGPFIHKMQKNLKDFEPHDFILCTGDPAIIGLSTAIVSDITNGCFNFLKWEKRERLYYPLSIDLHNKGERYER
tara:strand:+ start:568 stop:987 length:420 start_codon:yes stop_codon:yes gene_type:complete